MNTPRKGQVWRHKTLDADDKSNRFVIVKRRGDTVSYKRQDQDEEATNMSVGQFTADFELVA